jgi:hypothetical protein
MCGIIGYVTSKPANNRLKPILSQGLFADTFRGSCGTGVYGGNLRTSKGYTFKRAIEGPDFVRSRQFEEFGRKMHDFNVVIGHNRAATIGAGEDDNCHPFQFDHVGFVHNGTLSNYRTLVEDRTFNHSVDSAWAAKALSEKDNPVDVLTKVKGPYVFVWHNMKTNTFHIARNNNRDIWWINDKDNETLFFASEWGMLQWLLDRNGVDYGKSMFKCPKEHTMLTWNLDKVEGLKAPKVTTYEEYKEPPYVYQGRENGHGRWMGHGGSNTTGYRQNEWSQMGDWELSYGDTILVNLKMWERYGGYHDINPTAPGFMMGTLVEPGSKCDGVPVRLHRVTEAEGKAFLADGWAECRVSGVTTGLMNPLTKKEEAWVNANDAKLPKRLPTVVDKEGSKSTDSDKDPKEAVGKTKQATEKAQKDAGEAREAIVIDGEVLMTGKQGREPAIGADGGVVLGDEMFPGPQKAFLTAHEFREEVRSGCIYCGDPLSEKDAHDIEWVTWGGGDWLPLCIHCQRPEVIHELCLEDSPLAKAAKAH